MTGMFAVVAAGGLLGVGVVLVLWKRARSSRLLRCLSLKQMTGKVVLITGASAGLGREFAYEMAARGAEVVLACRDQRKAEESVNYILARCAERPSFDKSTAKIHLVDLDLSSLRSIQECAQTVKDQFRRIDILVNNAGVMCCPLSFTADGFETHLGVNHIGHFYLTNLLKDLVTNQAHHTRVLIVASGYYLKGRPMWNNWNVPDKAYPYYKPILGYARSKLANCLHSVALAKRWQGQNVGVYCIKPGFVGGTDLGRHRSPVLRFLARPLIWLISKSVAEGVQTYLHCALTDPLNELGKKGELYDNCAMAEWNRELVSEQLADEFWDLTQSWVDAKTVGETPFSPSGVANQQRPTSSSDGEHPMVSLTSADLVPSSSTPPASPLGGSSTALTGDSTPPLLISDDMMKSMTASATARMIDLRSPKKNASRKEGGVDDLKGDGGSLPVPLDVDESVELLELDEGGGDNLSLSVNFGSESGENNNNGDGDDDAGKTKDANAGDNKAMEVSQSSVGGTGDNGSDWETIDEPPLIKVSDYSDGESNK